ncbi:hypothetical protein K523DRAFT_322103 [Schizophyllum commune Tattone D]|nr:hypothetical protein K523DRAFT_322103 [Schizophyllum commune Tattone D]
MSFGLVSRDDREYILEYACDLVDECAGKQNANHLWMAKLLRKLSNEKIVQNDLYHDALHRFFPAQRALHIYGLWALWGFWICNGYGFGPWIS